MKQKIILFRPFTFRSPYPVIEQILNGFSERLDYLISRHAQISVCHLTVTIPIKTGTVAARFVGQSISKLRKKMKILGIESQAGWVREVSSNSKEHFHVGFLWDSTKIQNAARIGFMLNEHLSEILNISSNRCLVNVNPPNPFLDRQLDLNIRSNQTIKIHRSSEGFEDQRKNIIDWLSYLAKVETKGSFRDKHIREFGFSLYRKGK